MAHAIVARQLAESYRTSILGSFDPLFRRCLTAAGVVGVLVLVLTIVVPKRSLQIETIDKAPERIAKLILEEPKPVVAPAPKPAPKTEIAVKQPKPEPKVEPKPEVAKVKPKPVVKPKRKTPKPQVVAKKTPTKPTGDAGRAKAKEATKELADVKASLNSVLADVSSSLSNGSKKSKAPNRRSKSRRTRGGRSAAQLASVGTPVALPEVSAASSKIAGAQISVETLGTVDRSDLPDDPSGGSETNDLRSNSSLLSVVRKYAAGIQLCYDQVLEKNDGLAGKVVFQITVAANGRVADVRPTRDTVGSPELIRCATRQIQAWKFPKIREGMVTFQAPFVFTPPE